MITQTARLRLEALSLKDAPFILNLLNSPGWLKYIGDRGVKSLADAEAYLTDGPMKDLETYGFSLFKVVLKSTEEPIGLCGLLKRDFLDHPDIGFAFLGEYGGKGYAQEASHAVLEWARETQGITKVLAITLPENERSIHLLEKLGLNYERVVQYPDGASLSLYSN